MSQTLMKDKKILILSFVAAAATVIAGILHLQMAAGSLTHNLEQGILFLVGGILQVFWAVPVIKRWGRIWQIIGIVGTVVFFILWYASRIHLIPEGNEMRGGAFQGQTHSGNFSGGNIPEGGFSRGNRGPMGIGFQILRQPIEMCQIIFLGSYITLSVLLSKQKKANNKQPEKITEK